MTFGDLITQVSQDLWPFGEAENIVASHGRAFVKAMVDLQNAVECYRFGNTDTYPSCSTYFNCGLTVLPAPRGRIERIYTIGRAQSTTGTQTGTAVGSATVTAPLLVISGSRLIAPVTSGLVCNITTDGIYTITVVQAVNAASLYPFNSPQYYRTVINYTDTNGNPQSIQPADLIHVNVSTNTGATIINVKGGTSINYVITPFNNPQTDGAMTATFTVVSGATGTDDQDWCKKVDYHQVDYCHIERYVRACKNCNSTVFGVANALAQIFFGCSRTKSRYKQPTDIGYEQLPPLPQSFHYSQASTDAGYRSDQGVFAIHRGRIYVAPWIESTESLVIEWNGVKTNWASTDNVEDDPKFLQAVKLLVGIDHYMYYESDPTRMADFKRQMYGESGIVGVMQELIIDCRERNRVEICKAQGTKGSAATGIGVINGGSSATFTNTAQSYTASCPTGQNGNPVTINIAAGTVTSSLSVADANAQALSQAQAQAMAALQCSGGTGIFLNVAQTFTASCPVASGTTPAAVGTSVTVTVVAGTYQSVVSQALADAAALQAAQDQANSTLVCTFSNAPQTFTATCPTGTTGSSETSNISAGQFTSIISQLDADTMAQAAAQSAATAALTCAGIVVTVFNTIQTVTLSGSILLPGCSSAQAYNVSASCPANTYTQLATVLTQTAAQASVNAQASIFAQQQVQALFNIIKAQLQKNCTVQATIGGPQI